MKIKGKSQEQLTRAYYRILKTNPVKAGQIKGYLKAHHMARGLK